VNNKIKVSIILPVFNAEDFVEQAIKSVLDQSFKHFELILIDDGSTDRSLEKNQQFQDTKIKLIKYKTNRGNTIARNRGIDEAKGE